MTLFSQIIAKTIPADIVYEDDQYLVFKDIKPQMETHLLIIPKREIPSFHLAHTSEERIIVKGLLDIAWKLIDQYHLSGCQLHMNSGADHDQVVHHIHLHLMSHDTLK